GAPGFDGAFFFSAPGTRAPDLVVCFCALPARAGAIWSSAPRSTSTSALAGAARSRAANAMVGSDRIELRWRIQDLRFLVTLRAALPCAPARRAQDEVARWRRGSPRSAA